MLPDTKTFMGSKFAITVIKTRLQSDLLENMNSLEQLTPSAEVDNRFRQRESGGEKEILSFYKHKPRYILWKPLKL